jgi:hypothetical protein
LARWKLDQPTWNKFFVVEKRERFSSIYYEMFAIVLLGTTFLLLQRKADWKIAIPLSVVFAVIWGLAKYLLMLKPLQAANQQYEVILTTTSVLINNTHFVFRNEHKKPGKILLLTDQSPWVIEITFYWNTRRGETFEEIRIPVEPGRENEAINIVAILKSFL